MNSVGVSNPDIGYSHAGVFVSSPGMLTSSTGNQIFNNDSYNNPGGITNFFAISVAQISVTVNSDVAPQFANAAAHNYSLVPGSLPGMSGMIRR